jgi:hypothetical protein
MNKIFGSLAAATAAAGALSLITLAAASPPGSGPAAAATSSSSAITAGAQLNSSWAGWVDTMKHTGGRNRFNRVTATFKVPGINCSKSVIGTKLRFPGGPFSEAAFWVGLDGTNSDSGYLEQAGISAECASKTAYATYFSWYQMTPKDVNGVRLTGSKGNPATVRVGDSITVTVMDTAGVDPTSPKWDDPAYAGRVYSVRITDSTRHVGYYRNGLTPAGSTGYAGGRAPGTSAEVITEAPANGPWNKPHAVGLADMGTVSYTDVYVSSSATGWIYGLSMKSNGTWSADQWNAGHQHTLRVWGQNPKDHNKWEWYTVNTYWQTLMHPGSLGGTCPGCSSPFSTYWK